jgi:serine protease AprX
MFNKSTKVLAILFLIAVIAFPMLQSQKFSDSSGNNSNTMIKSPDDSIALTSAEIQSCRFGTLKSNSLCLGNEISSSQISSNIGLSCLTCASSSGTISTQFPFPRTEHADQSKKSKSIACSNEQVISPLLSQLLQGNASNTCIRVIITLKSQPQIEDSLHIKENTYQRIDNIAQSSSTDSLEFLEQVDRETQLMRRELKDNALDLTATSQDQLVNEILNLNGIVLHRYAFMNSIAAILSPDVIKILQFNANIQSIILDELQPILLDHSVPSIYATTWHSYGFDGAPWDVAVLDTGVDATHPALSTRVIDAQSFVSGITDPDDYQGHGTHVAGIIASTQAGAPGVAPGASIINCKISHDGWAYDSDVISGAEWAATGASDDAEIINHSFGVGQSKGEFIDAFVYYYDIIWIGAAGNDGPASGTVDEVGYNMITVGSMNDQNTNSRSDDVISSFSSRGPTWDYRIKPDLVAPGENIIAPNYDWEGGLFGLNPDYVSKSGTSMAAPHIAGAVALLYDYKMTEDTKYYKALLMQTADDWGTIGPDNTYGWGYVNMASAYSQRDNVLSGTVQQSESAWYRVYLTAGSSFQATLAFERHGVYYPSTNTYSLSVLSDLDLSLYGPDGSLLDSSTSGINNVEQVNTASAPQTGYYKIEVYGWGVDPNVLTESFSLAHDGGLVRIYQPDITGVTVNGISVASGATDGSYNRTELFNIEISVNDIDTISTNLNVQMEVYDPDGIYLVTHSMPYNSTANVWENTWIFGQDAMAGRWHTIVKTTDNTGLSAQDYSFYFWCDNELPKVHTISLSSSSVRRVNETLDISVNATDYHDGTALTTYFTYWMSNGTFGYYLMEQNPVNNLFYLNLTLPESAPLGIWDYSIFVQDSDMGYLWTENYTLEVLSHQYLLTILSPWGVPFGGGLYDAGTMTFVGLDMGIVSGGTGIRYVFLNWAGDSSGSNYATSNTITMDRPKTVSANWQTQYKLSCATYPSGLSPAPISTPSEEWLQVGTLVYLTAQTVNGYVFDYWAIDGSAQTPGVMSVEVTMNAPHIATAFYLNSQTTTTATTTTITTTTTTTTIAGQPAEGFSPILVIAVGAGVVAIVIVVVIILMRKRADSG